MVQRARRRHGGFEVTARARVMVIAAHPDDPEFLAGGTVARLVKEGREVTYVIVTNGNKGSSDPGARSEQLVPVRAAEQRRAAEVLGVARVEFLGYEDGELEDTRELRRDITRQIRRWTPDLIITLNPHRTYDNFPGWHRDHRTTGRVVLDCVYPLARDHLAFPELIPEYAPHEVREVYLVQWREPRLVIDITDTMDLKLAAIGCHASQIGDVETIETRMRNRAATIGRAVGYAYAEGFDHIVVPG
jgi:LmbE family N-acetylglucosaminyl deacetylase